MKPHPRIRKTIKWGGAVVTVLLVVVWIGSGWLMCGWAGKSQAGEHLQVLVIWGRIEISHWPSPSVPKWSRAVLESHPKLGFFQWSFGYSTMDIDIPLWAVAAPVLLPTALTWRLDTLARRRARVGFCPKCGYDRTGLVGGGGGGGVSGVW